jgi:hypothetical protein
MQVDRLWFTILFPQKKKNLYLKILCILDIFDKILINIKDFK